MSGSGPAVAPSGGPMKHVGQSALVVYPGLGSLWLEETEIVDGFVVGTVWEDAGIGVEKQVMNFPLSCVRKWDPPHPEL